MAEFASLIPSNINIRLSSRFSWLQCEGVGALKEQFTPSHCLFTGDVYLSNLVWFDLFVAYNYKLMMKMKTVTTS